MIELGEKSTSRMRGCRRLYSFFWGIGSTAISESDEVPGNAVSGRYDEASGPLLGREHGFQQYRNKIPISQQAEMSQNLYQSTSFWVTIAVIVIQYKIQVFKSPWSSSSNPQPYTQDVDYYAQRIQYLGVGRKLGKNNTVCRIFLVHENLKKCHL